MHMKRFSITIMLIIFVSLGVTSKPASDDGRLYLEVADTLYSQGVYVDNIRNDEILPSIGHPLTLILFKKFLNENRLHMTSFIILGLLLLLSFPRNNKIWFYVSILTLIVLSRSFIEEYLYIGGIESSLILAISFLCFATIRLSQRQQTLDHMLFSIALAYFILVRPVFLPAIIPITGLQIWFIYRNTLSTRKLLAALSGIILISMTSIWSYSLHQDNRMVSGTYGAIPLYCGFNPYIPINRTYNSTLWKTISIEKRNEPLGLLRNQDGWIERDKILKNKALKFIVSNPSKAFEAYLFRLEKFTVNSDSQVYKLIFSLTVITSLLIYTILLTKTVPINHFGTTALLSMFFILILTTSLFAFSGVRSLISPFIFLIFTLLNNLQILFKSVSTLKNNIKYTKDIQHIS